MKAQFCDRIPKRQHPGIRVRFRRQPGVMVPHQFHPHTLAPDQGTQLCAVCDAETVKVQTTAALVLTINASGFQVRLKSLCARQQPLEHKRFRVALRSPQPPQHFHKIGMQRQNGFPVIFGD
ncbi:MAG: hypothetical protein ABSA47_10515 [Verrucomicrobiota bacterium]